MTSPYISVPQYLTGSSNLTKKQMDQEQNFFLRIVRNELKMKIYRERCEFQDYKTLFSEHPQKVFAPSCAVCKKVTVAPSMHEHIITRGDVKGTDFEVYMQIFVPWNCVLVHEGECHIAAQSNPDIKKKVTDELANLYSINAINKWLDYMSSITNVRDSYRL